MIRRLAFFLTAIALASCGAKAVPSAPAHFAGTSFLRQHSNTNASLSFPIPSSDSTHGFVPLETAAVRVSIHGVPAYQSGFVLGQKSFSATFAAPSGKDTFDVYLVDQSGQPLAHGRTLQNIPAGQTTSLHVVFHGVIHQVKADLELNPPVGTSKALPFTITATDAAGDTISGPAAYDEPLNVSQKNASAQVKLQGHRFSSPGDTLHLAYNGRLMTKPVDIALSAPTSSGSYGTRPLSFLAQAYVTYTVPYGSQVRDIALAPNHVLWFARCGGGPCAIGSIDTGGHLKTVAKLGAVQNLVVGPDGNIWFTIGENERGQDGTTIGKMTPSGTVTHYLIHKYGPHTGFGTFSIAIGPDKNLWFTDLYGFDRMTKDGKVTQFPLAHGWFRPTYLVAGAEGKLYADDGVWSVVSCDGKGTLTNFGSFNKQLHAPLVWYDHRLLALGPMELSDGTIRKLKPRYAQPAANGPKGSLLGVGDSALGTPLYGIQVLQLKGFTLDGPTYPEVANGNGQRAYITKVIADNNGYFWAMNESSVLRFRYNP